MFIFLKEAVSPTPIRKWINLRQNCLLTFTWSVTFYTVCKVIFSHFSWKILHLAKIFTQPAVVIVVTNIRYGTICQCVTETWAVGCNLETGNSVSG